jgi:signal transduction histidine kinase
MIWNWLRRHPWLADSVFVFVLGAGYLINAAHSRHWLPGVPLALAITLPLLWRRRQSELVLLLVTTATAVNAFWYSEVAPFAPFAAGLAIYTVASHSPRRHALGASLAAAAILLAVVAIKGTAAQIIPDTVLFASAWAIGDSIGARRSYTRELEEKAERLERERATEAARAVAEEQTRIGRELHDVIAHNLSVIVVQAAAANDVFDSRPDLAREALYEIESTGRGALGELRRLLGAVSGGETDFAPPPGLEQLHSLIAQVRAAGLEVVVSVLGSPCVLPTAIDLSAYRVVQEALTNTLKHAQASRVGVDLHFTGDALAIAVRDNGRGNGVGGGTGSGLIGMRERVVTYGGTLQAGPAPGGGFAVEARFPLEDVA